MKRLFVLGAAVLAVAMLWSADAPAQQSDKVTIAIVIEQSGPGAAVGARWIRGVQMASDEINATGGILGKKIDTFILDTKTEAPVAVAAMRKAIESKPFIVMGPIFSGSTLAAMGLVRDAGIPEFVGSESPNVGKQNSANNTFLGSLNVELSMQKVAKATAKILQRAGVNFGIFGDAETCCGGRAYQMGYKDDFLSQARKNMEMIKKAGIKPMSFHCCLSIAVVTASLQPSCGLASM